MENANKKVEILSSSLAYSICNKCWNIVVGHLLVFMLQGFRSEVFSNFIYFFFILGDSNTEDQGSFQEAFIKQFQNLVTPLIVIGLLFSSFSFGPREQQQVFLLSWFCFIGEGSLVYPFTFYCTLLLNTIFFR